MAEFVSNSAILVGVRGFEPISGRTAEDPNAGQGQDKQGQNTPQVAHPQGLTNSPNVPDRTDSALARTPPRQPQTVKSTQSLRKINTKSGSIPPDLARIVGAWPRLPDGIKKGWLLVIDALAGEGGAK